MIKSGLLLIAFLVIACDRSPHHDFAPTSNQSSNLPLSFDLVKQVVLQKNCIGCHSGPTPDAGIDLSTERLLFQNKLVNLSQPNESKLIQVIRDGSMPPRGRLQESDIELVENYAESLIQKCYDLFDRNDS